MRERAREREKDERGRGCVFEREREREKERKSVGEWVRRREKKNLEKETKKQYSISYKSSGGQARY